MSETIRRLAPILLAAGALSLAIPATSAASTQGGGPLTTAERHWVGGLTPFFQKLAGSLRVVASTLGDPDRVVLVMGGDAKTRAKLDVALHGLENCAHVLGTRGRPPTARLGPIRTGLNGACGHYARSARLIASGLDHKRASDFTNANVQMRAGNRLLATAEKRMEALPH
ncbi:MAG TPA: hypothetical protein VGF23_16640 [Gaiellaceae bacterium]